MKPKAQGRLTAKQHRALGRLALAVAKGTGTKLSADEVRELAPLILALIRATADG